MAARKAPTKKRSSLNKWGWRQNESYGALCNLCGEMIMVGEIVFNRTRKEWSQTGGFSMTMHDVMHRSCMIDAAADAPLTWDQEKYDEIMQKYEKGEIL